MLVSGGDTDVTTHFKLRLAADGTAATGLDITDFDLTYVRSGETPAAKVDATALVAANSAHADNKAIEVDATNQPGLYRVDWPDAAFAAGVREVICTVKVATAFTEELRVEIDAIAPPVWDRVLTGATHNDPTSAGRRLRQLEQAFVHASGTLAAVTGNHTVTLDGGAVATANYYIGDRLQIIEGTGAGQSRLITAYDGSKVAILDSDWTTNPDTSSLYEVVAADVHVSLSDADLASGFVATYTNTTTITLDATNAVATTDFYVGEIIVFTHGLGAGQAREITGYTSGRVVTMSPALVTALDTTTVWHIQAMVSVPEIVTEILAGNIEGTHTLAEVLRVIAAAAGGKASGLETTTAIYRNLDDSKDRITATVDADGNRTAVTLDES